MLSDKVNSSRWFGITKNSDNATGAGNANSFALVNSSILNFYGWIVIRIVTLLFVLLNGYVFSAADSLGGLQTNDFPELKIMHSATYDGNSLWGYIDGGADLYLEYGFDSLLVQEIVLSEKSFRVELYHMKSAEAAYGIYSVMHFKPDASDSLPGWNCVSRYQVQFPRGKCYVTITNDRGSKEEQELGLQIAQVLWKRTNDAGFVFPEFFNNSLFVQYHKAMKFMNGKLGVQNGFQQFEKYLEDYTDYSLYVLPLHDSTVDGEVALIRFAKPKNRTGFCEQLGVRESKELQLVKDKNGFKAIKQISNGDLLLLESAREGAGVERVVDVLRQMNR